MTTAASTSAAHDLPPALQDSMARHRKNLTLMVAALRAVGMDDAAIELNLSVLIDSYRAELAAALHHLGREA